MRKLSFNAVFSVLIFFIVIIGASAFYHRLEGWNVLDRVYFTVMTITTVGYGDFVPLTNAGKVFTIFFSFIGIGIY